jgi:hypothetical protein
MLLNHPEVPIDAECMIASIDDQLRVRAERRRRAHTAKAKDGGPLIVVIARAWHHDASSILRSFGRGTGRRRRTSTGSSSP